MAALLTSCGGKSQANKEQIENARQEAAEMTEEYRGSIKVVDLSDTSSQKVQNLDEGTTEIIVSEAPAPEAAEKAAPESKKSPEGK